MIRLYEYTPRIDADGNTTEVYRDFQNYLFSQPYGFLFDWQTDKVIIYDIAYRLSSMQHINDGKQVTCVCVCGGGGNVGDGQGGSGTAGISRVKTDNTLQGEGNDAQPLGAKLSALPGNRLQVEADGLYVGGGFDDVPIIEPSVIYAGGWVNAGNIPQNVGDLDNLLVTGKNNPMNFISGEPVTYKTPSGIMRSYVIVPAGNSISKMYDVDNEQTIEDLLVKEPGKMTIGAVEYEKYYLKYLAPAAGEKTIEITIL